MNISELIQRITKIFIENQITNPESYDVFVDIVDGRIDGYAREDNLDDADVHQDLNRKMEAIRETELFAEFNRKQQRLLAFGAQWYKASKHQKIFAVGDKADAAHLRQRTRRALLVIG